MGLLPPHQGAPTGVVAAHPVKTFFLLVGVVFVVDKKIASLGLHGVFGASLLLLLLEHLARWLVHPVELPGHRVCRFVIDDVFDVVSPFQNESFEALFGQFLGGPAP